MNNLHWVMGMHSWSGSRGKNRILRTCPFCSRSLWTRDLHLLATPRNGGEKILVWSHHTKTKCRTSRLCGPAKLSSAGVSGKSAPTSPWLTATWSLPVFSLADQKPNIWRREKNEENKRLQEVKIQVVKSTSSTLIKPQVNGLGFCEGR